MALKTHKRSKSRFKSARAAWMDIGKKTGKSPRSVKKKKHTSTHWVFKMQGR